MKILIVRLSSIGDVVQGIPCLVALKRTFPDWKISWLVEETSFPLLDGHPCLDRLFVLNRKWRTSNPPPSATSWLEGFRNFKEVLGAIRKERFDVAIDLQGLFKSGLWTWLSHAPRRIGHNRTREFAHIFLNDFVGDRPMFDPAFSLVDRYLEPAKALGADLSRAEYVLPNSTKEAIDRADLLLGSKDRSAQWIGLCPWSAWPSKNWPVTSWRELIQVLVARHRLLLLGSSAEVPLIPSLLDADHLHVLDLVGKTSLAVLAEIFRRCKIVIGPDTGPVHLANATGVPHILMLFGSTSWKRSGPWGKDHATLSLDLECQPCFSRVCPLEHHHCLNHLETDTVLKRISPWMEPL